MDNHGIFGRWIGSGPGELFKVRNNVGKLLQGKKLWKISRAQEMSLYLTSSNVFVHS